MKSDNHDFEHPCSAQRSRDILGQPEWSDLRCVYKSMGYSDDDLKRPLIGIANTWNEANPGHTNLRQLADYVKRGVYRAGGTPMEFGTIAIVQDGDLITVDVRKRDLHLHLTDEEIAERLKNWHYEPPRVRGYLSLYAKLARSADKGGILE